MEDIGNRTTLLAHALNVSPCALSYFMSSAYVLLDQTLGQSLIAPGIHVYLYAFLQSHLFGTEMIRVMKGFYKSVLHLQLSTVPNDQYLVYS